MSDFPIITVQNKLDVPFVFYDSFRDADAAEGATTVFGTLTPLATLPPGASQTVIPIHGPVSAYFAYNTDGSPLAREVTMGDAPTTFVIDHKDSKRIDETGRFVDFILANPGDSLATSFNPLLTDPQAPRKINAFFADQPPYKDCTYVSYLMVVAARARKPGQSVENASYSLSALCNSLGGIWPPEFPDITVTNFRCSDTNDTLILGGDLELSSLPFDPISAPFIRSLLPATTAEATFRFHHAFDLGALGTKIELVLPAMTLVPGVELKKPTISLDINPLFKFVVFSVKATLPFSLFGSPTFDANLSLTIDNLEASIGIVIDGEHGSLLTPPVMKGVHFDEFGVGMGLFFEPPGYVLGVQGKFHIGDGDRIVALDDDTFTVVCRIEGDVPDPLYIAFYVPKMQLGDIITMFTDSNVDLGLPITITDLSYHWSREALEPVILPDGTLSKPGYGFSGGLDLFGLSFYGEHEIDMTGLKANLTMAPFSAGPLAISGNGAGVTIKVDANGSPIRNTHLAKTRELRDAIANAATKQLVAPGGPSLTIDTGSSPFLSLGASIGLFDVINDSVSATVASDGITWEQDCGAVLREKMRCTLSDLHHFSGAFEYGLDLIIPLPTIAGFSLGSIPLKATFNGTLAIDTSDASDLKMTVGGGFDFEGLSFSIGTIPIDVHTGKLGDLISTIGQYILDHAKDLFAAIIGDVGKWAQLVFKGLIIGVTAIADGLKTAFGKTAAEVAGIMGAAGYGIDVAATAIRNAFGASAQEVASALQDGYHEAAKGVATALKGAGYAVSEVSQALSSVFSLSPSDINGLLQDIGFPASAIEDAFKNLGGEFSDFAHHTWDKVSDFFTSGSC